MSAPGHSYTTQPASHYGPAQSTPYPPPQSQMTGGVQINLGDWGLSCVYCLQCSCECLIDVDTKEDGRDSDDEDLGQDAGATSNLSGHVPKSPPTNPSAGRQCECTHYIGSTNHPSPLPSPIKVPIQCPTARSSSLQVLSKVLPTSGCRTPWAGIAARVTGGE